MQVQSLNISNNTNYSNSIDKYIYYVNQGLGFVYTSLCIFWLVYVIWNLISQIRIRSKLVALTYPDSCHDYANRPFMQKETILRNSIFLVFLCFELIYCLIINIYGFIAIFSPLPYIPISINPDCMLTSGTFLAWTYDNRSRMFLLKFFCKFIRDVSFSMLIWMFVHPSSI